MSHLIQGGICFSQLNATVSMMSVIDTGNLLVLILSQEDSMQVGNEMDKRHSEICWQSDKVVR